MLNDPFLLLVAGLAAAGAAVLLVGGPRGTVLAALIAARSLTDIGASSGGSLLPSSTLSVVLSGGLVLLCILPQRQKVGPKIAALITLSVLFLAISALVTWIQFGVGVGSLRESLRLISYVAVFATSYRAAQASPNGLPRLIAVVTLIPGILLIAAYGFGWAPTLNAAGRAVGSFSHANAAAAYFGVTTIVSVALLWSTKRRLLLACGAVSVLALVLTQSLGNMLGAAFGITVLVLLNSNLSLGRRLFFIIASCALATTLFFTLGASNRLSELDGTDLGAALGTGVSGNSLEWRVINWRMLIDLWWEGSPIVGFGIGSTSTSVMPLGAPPHSLPIQILVETGFLGIGICAVLLAALITALRRRARSQRIEVALVAALLGFTLLSGSASNLIGYTAAGYVIFLTVGYTLGATRSSSGAIHTSKRLATKKVPR